MNCKWKDITTPDERGKRRVQCIRCHKRGVSPYPHDRIISDCRAWPLFPEVGYWLSLVLGAFGITKQRWNSLRKRMGLIEPCSCEDREKWLNTLGGMFMMRWKKLTSGSRQSNADPRPPVA